MKSIINKLFAGVALTAALGLGSCVNDLDLKPLDPNTQTAENYAGDPREFVGGLMAKCYSSLAVSGQYGAESADIAGLDNGTSQYIRAVFMMQEFPTDECLWIWQDEGVYDICTNAYATANVNIFGAYSRFMVHVAICNNFIRTVDNLGDYGMSADAALQQEIDRFKLEARALRALSYYYMIDIFGQCSWVWDDMAMGAIPEQISRVEAFNRVVADLEDVRAKWYEKGYQNTPVVYGRIGIDAIEGLLAKFYLNAEVYTGKAEWKKCYEVCQSVIARHEGKGGFNNSGLANCYQALFCGNNDMFAPGGAHADQNEILWVVPQEYRLTESYGCTMFLIAAAVTDGSNKDGYSNSLDYGLNANWKCMHAREQFSRLFGFQSGVSEDKRTLMWCTDNMGHHIANTDFMTFTDGYLPLKFSNLRCNPDGSFPYNEAPIYKRDKDGKIEMDKEGNPVVLTTFNRFGDPTLNDPWYKTTNTFPDTDFPVIRLADVYLMAAEATMHNAGSREDGARYASYVRERAGLPAWQPGDLNAVNILNERARELYWENVRRTDLVRFKKFTGANYLWSWKGGVYEGTNTPATQDLMPIPSQVIAAQPSFKQNPGY